MLCPALEKAIEGGDGSVGKTLASQAWGVNIILSTLLKGQLW